MALDVNRWFKYAKARLDSAVGQGNRSLDRLEAEREADLADKPWLRSDREAPTLDEARARIEWEAERQRRGPAPGPTSTAADRVGGPAGPAGPAPRSPQDVAADAEQEAARLELARREEQSAARLEQIRKELGVEAPRAGPAAPAAGTPPADGAPPAGDQP